MKTQQLLPWGSVAAAACSRRLAEALADRAGDWAAARAARGGGVVQENLRLVTGRTPAPESVRGVFRTYARYYLGVMRLAHRSPAAALGTLRWAGVEALDASRARGHGLVVLSAHFGHWDAVGTMLAARFGPVCTFAERLSPPSLFEFYSKLRQRHGVHAVPVGAPGRAPFEILRRNGVVAFVADRPFGNRTATVRCGGATLSIPTGAIRMAIRTGAPIHSVFAVREPGGFVIQCSAELGRDAAVGADEATLVQQIAAAFGARLQALVSAHPEQWCMLMPLAPPPTIARLQTAAPASRGAA